MSTRNKFGILIGIILVASLAYYLLSTPRDKDMVLIGTVDGNQVIVSPQIQGRLAQLLVDEGTPVKQGDLIAVLDPSELEAEERAAAANITSLQHKVAEMRAHGASHPGIHFQQCDQCAGQTAIGARTTAASASHFAAHPERQPAHHRAGQGGSGFRPGPGASRDQSAGAAGRGAVAERAGQRRRSRCEYRDCQHPSGARRAKHGGSHAGRSGECGRDAQRS